ncbi:MAG: hypothetical protein JOY57_14200, partial [Actinobacteria bacterium]|nr:hypothetical protein [Actinomycetota bacterium]
MNRVRWVAAAIGVVLVAGVTAAVVHHDGTKPRSVHLAAPSTTTTGSTSTSTTVAPTTVAPGTSATPGTARPRAAAPSAPSGWTACGSG